MSAPHSTNFVPSSSSEPPVCEAKSIEVTPPKKIKVDLQESKPKAPNPPKGKLHDKPAWVCHFYGKSRHICPKIGRASCRERVSV